MKTTGAGSVREVAEHLSLHPETVRIMAREDSFPGAFKLGSARTAQVRIPWQSVADWVATRRPVSA